MTDHRWVHYGPEDDDPFCLNCGMPATDVDSTGECAKAGRTNYTVAKFDELRGRYGSAIGWKATTPAEAVMRCHQWPRRRQDWSFDLDELDDLGGGRYRLRGTTYRVTCPDPITNPTNEMSTP